MNTGDDTSVATVNPKLDLARRVFVGSSPSEIVSVQVRVGVSAGDEDQRRQRDCEKNGGILFVPEKAGSGSCAVAVWASQSEGKAQLGNTGMRVCECLRVLKVRVCVYACVYAGTVQVVGLQRLTDTHSNLLLICTCA